MKDKIIFCDHICHVIKINWIFRRFISAYLFGKTTEFRRISIEEVLLNCEYFWKLVLPFFIHNSHIKNELKRKRT